MARSYPRSPFHEHTAHSSVLTQKEVSGITSVMEEMEKKADFLIADRALFRGHTNYHVPYGFADSKMGEIG